MQGSEYEKMNTVRSDGQIKGNEYVSFEFGKGKRRITVVGNSLLRHSRAPQIGWYGDWGMAASCRENDFAHQLKKGLEARGEAPGLCMAQASIWERDYPDDPDILEKNFSNAREFDADTLVIRIGENMRKDVLAESKPHFEKMIGFFITPSTKKVVVTDSFWENPLRDGIIREICSQNGYTLCQISDLSKDESNMAIGLFEHKGVSVHPSDKGMKLIAERLLALI